MSHKKPRKVRTYYVGFVNGRPHREKVYGETGGYVLTAFLERREARKVYEDVRAFHLTPADGGVVKNG